MNHLLTGMILHKQSLMAAMYVKAMNEFGFFIGDDDDVALVPV